MPIFSYLCKQCDHRFDKLVQKTDDPPACPECGGKTQKVWSIPAPAAWKCSKGSL